VITAPGAARSGEEIGAQVDTTTKDLYENRLANMGQNSLSTGEQTTHRAHGERQAFFYFSMKCRCTQQNLQNRPSEAG